MADESRPKHPGGRPKNSESTKRGNIFKRCPCPDRKHAKCPHDWYYTYRRGGLGGLRRGNLNKLVNDKWLSKTEAQDTFARLVKVPVDAGEFSKPTASSPDTRLSTADGFWRFHEAFAKDPERRPHRVVRLKKQLTYILSTVLTLTRGARMAFGDVPLPDVTTAIILALRDGLHERLQQNQRDRDERAARLAKGDTNARALAVSPARPRGRNGQVGTKRNLEVVRAGINWLIENGLYPHENPFLFRGQRVVKFAKGKRRTRRLLSGEEQSLLANAVDHLKALIIAAVETGGRRGELLSLQWKDVKVDSHGAPTHITFLAENTKTDEQRTVPVSLRLRAVLEMRRLATDGQPHPPTAHVFGNSVGEKFDSVKTAWKSCCQKAKVEGLTFHDLRREAGSRWLDGGLPLSVVSKLLGHKSVNTTSIYIFADVQHVEDEWRRYQQRQTSPAAAPPPPRPTKARRGGAAARPN
jgi:integrase